MELNRDEALALMHEYTANENLRRHMYAVEAAMRAYARQYGEDEELWGITGLLHDFDYERWPNDERKPDDEHPSTGVAILKEKGYPEEMRQAIMGHADYTGVPRESRMAKTLFAVDELTGLLTACALVRPNGLADLKVKSVKKKLKDSSFARGVNREDVKKGIEELGVDFNEHVQLVIEAMREIADELGLLGSDDSQSDSV
ncbi:MAG: HDIG domain-containing protein [Gemmatimonadetes bacterium]|uniref:HDIG domain-containing protein n=1 Tax=Candidatus Kutchimonas denitrificans TaxID=3056748 RepID=A0AAE4Z9Y1_9BACT|nr:HDIG domain-containing protein [Gemmatimonadota bacterium]NIR76298.1 HDIG domain-containing protein [Candidatus Kutchimonas denitrificans]NIS02321.1 HDIG domain-containing protein [Gemmatimonadota bacterium]NIT68140.1 HDIG domain-containing protein [Gemmatimonadota bacterium]NIU54364.1 HDIG domain-containing protein [Gemmatimonadota bacterium]